LAVLLAGALKDKFGSYSSCFLFGGSTLLVACLLMTVINLWHCRREPRSV